VWLIIVNRLRFYDLYSWTTIKASEIRYRRMINPIVWQVMEFLEKEWLEYIVGWFNETHIAIVNHWKRITKQWGKKVYSSWSYWIKHIPRQVMADINNDSLRIQWHTILKWSSMLHILSCVIDYVAEKDIVKSPTVTPWQWIWLTRKQKIVYNQVIIYSKRVSSLSSKLDATQEDFDELAWYVWLDQRAADTIVQWLNNDKKNTINKIKALVKTNKKYKEVINAYI